MELSSMLMQTREELNKNIGTRIAETANIQQTSLANLTNINETKLDNIRKAVEDNYSKTTTNDFDNVVLGENEYFVMGDNRAVSSDSRIKGPVNIKNIKGKTNLIIFPFNKMGTVE